MKLKVEEHQAQEQQQTDPQQQEPEIPNLPSSTSTNNNNNNNNINNINTMRFKQMIDALSFENVLHTFPHGHHNHQHPRPIIRPNLQKHNQHQHKHYHPHHRLSEDTHSQSSTLHEHDSLQVEERVLPSKESETASSTTTKNQFSIPRPFRKLYKTVIGSNTKKKNKQKGDTDESATVVTTTLTTTPTTASMATMDQSIQTASSTVIPPPELATTVLEYSVSAESEGSELFYDALQSMSDTSFSNHNFENDNNSNIDSSLDDPYATVPFGLPDILVHRGGFETILDDQYNTNTHDYSDYNEDNYNNNNNNNHHYHNDVFRQQPQQDTSTVAGAVVDDNSYDSTDENFNVTGVFTGIGPTMTFLSTHSNLGTDPQSYCNNNMVGGFVPPPPPPRQQERISSTTYIPPPPPPQQQQLQYQTSDTITIPPPPPPPPRDIQQEEQIQLTKEDYPLKAVPAPKELPLRFLRAGKNDPIVGQTRYEQTIQWRYDEEIDTILREPSPNFDIIKQHYPHYCHRHGLNGEPCFYEQPPKTNLKALRDGGVTLDTLIRHYAQVSEYQWQYITQDDLQRSIYIIDLDGIRFGDFVGETVDFVKRASGLSATHYPERAGVVYVINVPVWFKVIWSVVKPIIDEATLQKIFILRGKDEIRTKMQEKIAVENIPPEYGGTSMPLGSSPEEIVLKELIHHNNYLSAQNKVRCDNYASCKFCSWQPPRSY